MRPAAQYTQLILFPHKSLAASDESKATEEEEEDNPDYQEIAHPMFPAMRYESTG
jgi:hypothetical protein